MKSTFRIIFAVLSISFILIIDGCVPSKPVEEIELLPSERLLSKLEANRRKIKTFEGSGTLNIKSSQMNNSASFRVVLAKPDSIYLTILGPFGIEIAQAMVTNKNFTFYDALQNTAYTGDVNDDILRQIFKIDLSFNDLMDAFVGSVNLTKNLYKNPNSYEVIYDKYQLTYNDSLSKASSVYEVDVRNLGITKYLLKNQEGENVLEGNYSKFDIVENVAVPYHIDVKNKKENQSITIDYRSMAANKKNIYIDFKLPSDADVIKW